MISIMAGAEWNFIVVDLHFSNSDAEHDLMCLLGICMSSLEKISIQAFFPLFDWNFSKLSCLSSLYILDTCMCAQSYLTLCDPMGCSPQGFSVMEFSRQECWNELPFPTPGDLPNPGNEHASSVSPELTGKFVITIPPGTSKFAYIFSPSTSCIFVWSVVSFAVQKLLSLIRFHLFVFAFISFALGDRSKKNIAAIYCWGPLMDWNLVVWSRR